MLIFADINTKRMNNNKTKTMMVSRNGSDWTIIKNDCSSEKDNKLTAKDGKIQIPLLSNLSKEAFSELGEILCR